MYVYILNVFMYILHVRIMYMNIYIYIYIGSAIDEYLGPGEKMGGMCICIDIFMYIWESMYVLNVCMYIYVYICIYICISLYT
jgi:hypothetical protein